MLLRDLTRVWVSEYETISNHGEKLKKWKMKDEKIWLNIQQDINELDRNSSGEVDYSIEKARTNMDYDIQKGNGISIEDKSSLENFVPDYIVTDKIKIGSTTLYKMEKYNGD